MSYNQILTKKFLGVVTKNGKQVTLSAALQTSHWTRAEFAADGMKDDFEKAVDNYTGQLPENTTEICARCAERLWHYCSLKANLHHREADHTSNKDSRDHITGVCFNADGDGKTVHSPTR